MSNQQFTGYLSEAAAFGSALSAARIRQHYLTSQSIPGNYYSEVLNDSPTGYWRLAANGNDYTAAHNNGTLSGTTTVSQAGPWNTADPRNTITLYFRELTVDEVLQNNLNGETQAQLNGLHQAPDYFATAYTTRTQAFIDAIPQLGLDNLTQTQLEHRPDTLHTAYIAVQFTWDLIENGTLSILNENGTGYTFTNIAISANTPYLLAVDLQERSIRVQIFQTDVGGTYKQNNLVYDTTTITDEILFRRRKGRFGWWARFADGDASLDNVRPRGLTFAQFTTKSWTSVTPVEGASLFAEATPDRELWTGWGGSPWGGQILEDVSKSASGKAFQVTTTANVPLQGIMTNPMYIDNWDELEITFDLLFPSSAFLGDDPGLDVFLYGEYGRVIPLHMPTVVGDNWQTVRIYPDGSSAQTGTYWLVILQSLPPSNTVWYVNNTSVKIRAVRWEARGKNSDAWGIGGGIWVPFKNAMNQQAAGVMFDQRGKELQLRGTALRQDVTVASFKVQPKYAQLSNPLWRDQFPLARTTAVPASTVTPTTLTVVVDSSPSTGCRWHFWFWGDGDWDFGDKVAHVYRRSGRYTIHHWGIDANGNRVSETKTVTVTG